MISFANPEGNIKQFGLTPGSRVADLGCGVGAYTIPLARAVGDTGRVYAVEVQKDFLSNIRTAAAQEGLVNIEYIWGDIERIGATKIKDGGVQAAVVGNVFFQVENREGFFEELRRILIPGGRVLVVDWKDSYSGMGPDPSHVVRADEMCDMFTAHGFSVEHEIETGSQHYGFIFVKN